MAAYSNTIGALFDHVVKPLVLGGTIRPVEPIGAATAQAIAQEAAQTVTAAESSWINVGRVRRVRALCPVDALPSLTACEWLMVIAFNDLLRSTDPKLKSFLIPGRAGQVVDAALEVLTQVPAARTLGEALARHATFCAIMSLRRTDTTVSWWCGSRAFAGRTPPDTLLSWPRVRRVRTQREELELVSMAAGSESTKAVYVEAIRALLARTPLTDLATAGRAAPAFVWSTPTVSLLSCAAGRKVALRALRLDASTGVRAAVRKAAATMTAPCPDIRRTVNSVVEELERWHSAV